LATIRKSVNRMKFVDELETKGVMANMPKQEVSKMKRENAKLHKNLDGIRNMEKYPGVLVVVDVPREEIAVKEARRLGIPIVAIVDTNADPGLVDYPVVGNDDAIRSIRTILEAFNNAIIEGISQAAKRRGESTNPTAAEERESLTGVSA